MLCVSDTLHTQYVNYLAIEIKVLNYNSGLSFGDHEYSRLLFGDDIADSEEKTTAKAELFQQCCCKWRIFMNMGQTTIVCYNPTNMARKHFQFKVGDMEVEYVFKYMYLGSWLEENLNMSLNMCEGVGWTRSQETLSV